MKKELEIKRRKKLAIKAAREAGNLLKTYFGRTIQVRAKGERSLVTNIDLKAEEKIVNLIKKDYPEDNILSEETKYQKRRLEKIADADAKNYSDAELTKHIQNVFDEEGWFTAADRQDAANYWMQARALGMGNQEIYRMLNKANEGGDFEESIAKDYMDTFVEAADTVRLKELLKNSPNDVLSSTQENSTSPPSENAGSLFDNVVKNRGGNTGISG